MFNHKGLGSWHWIFLLFFPSTPLSILSLTLQVQLSVNLQLHSTRQCTICTISINHNTSKYCYSCGSQQHTTYTTHHCPPLPTIAHHTPNHDTQSPTLAFTTSATHPHSWTCHEPHTIWITDVTDLSSSPSLSNLRYSMFSRGTNQDKFFLRKLLELFTSGGVSEYLKQCGFTSFFMCWIKICKHLGFWLSGSLSNWR